MFHPPVLGEVVGTPLACQIKLADTPCIGI